MYSSSDYLDLEDNSANDRKLMGRYCMWEKMAMEITEGKGKKE